MKRYTKEYISELLGKYMAGTSSIDEEDILSRYFAQRRVPAEWEQYRLLFAEIEAMRPKRPGRRWVGWCAAAAVAGVVFAVTVSQHRGTMGAPGSGALTARADTIVLRPEAPNEQPLPDTTVLQKQPVKPRRSRMRKPEPTMLDYDKAYALMAQAEKEQQDALQEVEQAQQEVLHAWLTAAGFVAIQKEDGSIVYVDEPKEYFAYEE